ncbi:hypothetical protein OOZ15_10120 [Galbibacter sp. EGI 63066]|uniref:hypothetical protein n=1 Tax=Galbibacter sp. EGI 63066 TaxID=2993559 RepID=UPI0022497637|nr:hypothetical protein [Galbibacter sp. EGI 63066]MCX2680295.1 hypothetical protein [Galbibacter sp. EGI 63066]
MAGNQFKAMMIFFSILFGLLFINVILLVFSVNKLPKLQKTKRQPIYNSPNVKDNVKTEKKTKDAEEYDVVLKEAI